MASEAGKREPAGEHEGNQVMRLAICAALALADASFSGSLAAAEPAWLPQRALQLPCVSAEGRDGRIHIHNRCSRDAYWAACVWAPEARRTDRYAGPPLAPMADYDFAPADADSPIVYYLISSFGPGDFKCD